MPPTTPVTHEEALDNLGPCLFFLNPRSEHQAHMTNLLTCAECQPRLKSRIEADGFEGIPTCSLASIAKREINKGTVTDTGLMFAVSVHFETCALHQQQGVTPVVRNLLLIGLTIILILIVVYLFVLR